MQYWWTCESLIESKSLIVGPTCHFGLTSQSVKLQLSRLIRDKSVWRRSAAHVWKPHICQWTFEAQNQINSVCSVLIYWYPNIFEFYFLQLLDYHSKPPLGHLQDSPAFRKPPSRPPPLSLGVGGSTAGQINVSHGQQSPVSPQSPAVDTRMRARHSPKAQTFPHFQKQDMSVGEAHRQDEERAPFTLTFSKLYNLKGLKNRVNQLPGQNRGGGGSSPPVQGHKSTG